jgi:hypothetical protein
MLDPHPAPAVGLATPPEVRCWMGVQSARGSIVT